MLASPIWRNPSFVRLFSAATVSLFGSLITRTALPFAAIITLDASPLAVGMISVANMLPGFLLGLVVGAWVDRRHRRPLMVASDLLRALLLLSVPIAAITGHLSLGLLLVVAAGMSVLDVVFEVADRSILPTIVERDHLVDANAALSASGSIVETASFGLGGWLVQLFTAPFAILIDAVSFLVSAIFLHGIQESRHEPAPEPEADPADSPSIFSEALMGLRVVRDNPVLRSLWLSNVAAALAHGVSMAAFLIFVNRDLGFGTGVLGMIFALGGIGSLLGALATNRLSALPLGPLLIGCFAAGAVGFALVPLAPAAGVVGAAFLIGQQLINDPAITIYAINEVSVRQGIVGEELMGRVNATFRVGEVGAQLTGSLLGGLAGSAFGARSALWIGVVAMILGTVWLFASPVRRLETVTPLEATS